jgi:hypothetical protein
MTTQISERLTPAQIEQRLEEIEQDLASRQNEYEEVSEQLVRCQRDWERRFAMARIVATGKDADSRKAAAFVAAAEPDDLYERLTDCEARHNALKVVVGVLEKRSVIGMSLLKRA